MGINALSVNICDGLGAGSLALSRQIYTFSTNTTHAVGHLQMEHYGKEKAWQMHLGIQIGLAR